MFTVTPLLENKTNLYARWSIRIVESVIAYHRRGTTVEDDHAKYIPNPICWSGK